MKYIKVTADEIGLLDYNSKQLQRDMIDLSIFASLDSFDTVKMSAGLLDKFKIPDFGKLLKKLGLHLKTSDGLIQMLFKSGIHVAKLFWYAVKATVSKNPKAKEDFINKIKKTTVTKEQMLDFLLKLDTVTLHLVTGPIHMLDATLGWHLGANIKHSIEKIDDIIKKAIETIKKSVKTLNKGKRAVINKHLTKIDKLVAMSL